MASNPRVGVDDPPAADELASGWRAHASRPSALAAASEADPAQQVTAGKNFDASGAFGPWLLTADEVADPSCLTLQTRVNGTVRQNLVLSDLIFSFADLISYISEILTLQVGDVIATGSPAGIGALTGDWLRPGDRVEIEIPQVGALSNPVIAEA